MRLRIVEILLAYGAAAGFALWYHYDHQYGIPLGLALLGVGVVLHKKIG